MNPIITNTYSYRLKNYSPSTAMNNQFVQTKKKKLISIFLTRKDKDTKKFFIHPQINNINKSIHTRFLMLKSVP